MGHMQALSTFLGCTPWQHRVQSRGTLWYRVVPSEPGYSSLLVPCAQLLHLPDSDRLLLMEPPANNWQRPPCGIPDILEGEASRFQLVCQATLSSPRLFLPRM